MTGAFLTLSALVCGGSSAALAQLTHLAAPNDPEVVRPLGSMALCVLVAGLGCLIWSKGA